MTQFGAQPPVQTWSNPPRKPVWPTVIGVISIVLASLAIICTPVSLAINAANPAYANLMGRLPEWFATYQLVATFFGIGASFLLLAGGIQLVRRRPSARAILLIYAGIGLAGQVVGLLAVGSALSGADLAGPERAGFIGGMCGGMVAGLAYPVFLLIWFLRGGIRREMATWSPGPANPYGQ